jgi:hypothetical protein
MALSPTISVCFRDNCKTIRVQDSTGAYNVSTNTGGWGAPNTTLAGADPVTLEITLADQITTATFTLTSVVNAATIIDGKFLLDDIVTNDFTGQAAGTFEDGILHFVYTVTDGSTEYTYDADILNTCSVECCIEKMRANFKKELCGCDWDNYWEQYNNALMLLEDIKWAFSCGDFTKARKALKALQKICKIVNCSC